MSKAFNGTFFSTLVDCTKRLTLLSQVRIQKQNPITVQLFANHLDAARLCPSCIALLASPCQVAGSGDLSRQFE